MTIKWSTYDQTLPPISGIEVNTGYLNNGVLSLIDNGGILVSKIFSRASSTIYYVQRSIVSIYIVNGIYTPPHGGVNYLVTENGDFLVTENGDNLIN
jgi:hypothetical protein